MKLKFLGIILMTSQLGTQAWAVNHKLLESEASAITHRIASEVPSDEKFIRKNLTFLGKEDEVEWEKKTDNFSQVCEEAKEKIKLAYFVKFLEACQTVFQEGTPLQKVGVSLLLGKVTEQTNDILRRRQRREERKEAKQPPTSKTHEEVNWQTVFSNDRPVLTN